MRIQLHGLVAGTPIFFCRASLVLPFSSVLMGAAPARFHFVGQYSVRETNAQPAPATGLFTGFGVRPQQAETAVSGNAGNRSFEPLWEQRHCLRSSELPSNVPAHIKMAKADLAIQLWHRHIELCVRSIFILLFCLRVCMI